MKEFYNWFVEIIIPLNDNMWIRSDVIFQLYCQKNENKETYKKNKFICNFSKFVSIDNELSTTYRNEVDSNLKRKISTFTSKHPKQQMILY